MDDQNNKNLYCSCTGDCCPPKKDKIWKKILFFVVILAAVSLAFMKLSSESKGNSQITNDTIVTQQPFLVDTTWNMNCSKTCDPAKNPSCCPQTKK